MTAAPPRALFLLGLLLACDGGDKAGSSDTGGADGADGGDGGADGGGDGGTDGGGLQLPTIDGATLSPDVAFIGDTLTCTPGATSDPLGETVDVLFAWEVDGALTDDTGPTAIAPARGASVRCGAIPMAGERVGDTAWAGPLVISNTPPTASGAEITPEVPSTADLLSCAALGADDADGDPLSETCAWTINGAPAGGAACTLDAGVAVRGDEVACTLTLSDGVDAAAPVTSAAVLIGNAGPTVSDHALSPDPAGAGDTITATWAAADPDGDWFTEGHAWAINGAPQGATGDTLWPGDFVRGDTVEHTLTVDDGLTSTISVVALTIGNTAPEAPELALSRAVPRVDGSDLVCIVDVESFDLDSDLVDYTVSWTVDGVAVTSGLSTTTLTDDTVPASLFVEGETWICTVTPDDGADVGPAASIAATVGPALPDLIVDNTWVQLTAGVYEYAEVSVINGGTLEITGLVELMADSFTVDATALVDGYALGEVAGAGAGAGTASSNSGGGGGSHGGIGGTGGYDGGDTPGVGGTEVGDATSEDIDAGSGGGTGGSQLGGAGGAGLGVWAELIDIAGVVDLRGGVGLDGGQCSGGGAGGGLLLVGDSVWLSGEVWASGGQGGQGTSTANDSGGGGGGGRFKVFYDSAYLLSGAVDVSGGAGGPYGTQAPSTAGAAGTTHSAVQAWP